MLHRLSFCCSLVYSYQALKFCCPCDIFSYLIILHLVDQYKQAIAELAGWYEQGKLKAKETVMDGIENLGNAFVSVLTGGNIGKQLVKVSQD